MRTIEIESNIDHVYAEKYGKVVYLRLTCPLTTYNTVGWVSLGTLSSPLRPSQTLDFTILDNNTGTYTTNNIINLRIIYSGDISVYAFSDHKTFSAQGTVTYLVRN